MYIFQFKAFLTMSNSQQHFSICFVLCCARRRDNKYVTINTGTINKKMIHQIYFISSTHCYVDRFCWSFPCLLSTTTYFIFVVVIVEKKIKFDQIGIVCTIFVCVIILCSLNKALGIAMNEKALRLDSCEIDQN